MLAAQTGAERSAAGSLDLVQAQYKAGGASYLQVLTAEQAYQNAALALVKARAQRFIDTAALFQALGGGWWNRADSAAGTADSATAPKESPDDAYPGAREPRSPGRDGWWFRSSSWCCSSPWWWAVCSDGRPSPARSSRSSWRRPRRAPQTVSTVKAARTSWQAQVHAIGSLRAVRGADLSAQASGVVKAIEFDSGNDVPAGKVLLRLRPNDDFAKLDQLEAAAELAAQTLKRDQEQFAAQAVSQAMIDTDVSTLKSARAQVIAQRALIEEKIVKAPFAGRLGIRQVDVGQYLAAGTTIVTLQALDPILIDFYVPQQALRDMRPGQAVAASVDTFPGVAFPGAIESVNSKVDPASRNVQIRASFRNADHRLVPGMFASVSIDAGPATSEVTLPQTAITYNPYGNTVFVVEHGTSGGKPQRHGAAALCQAGRYPRRSGRRVERRCAGRRGGVRRTNEAP